MARMITIKEKGRICYGTLHLSYITRPNDPMKPVDRKKIPGLSIDNIFPETVEINSNIYSVKRNEDSISYVSMDCVCEFMDDIHAITIGDSLDAVRALIAHKEVVDTIESLAVDHNRYAVHIERTKSDKYTRSHMEKLLEHELSTQLLNTLHYNKGA